MTAENDLAQAALDYAAKGWPVIPLHSPRACGCSCGRADCAKPGKHPRTAHGYKDASRDPGTIREWWRRWPDANIGIVTGPESGILVLDVDGEKGRASLAMQEAQHGPLPITLTSVTGRKDGGEHRWFRYPAERAIRGNNGKLGAGLDVRGAGGHVVVPYSVHESGREYQWAEPQHPISDAPDWLIEMLTDRTVPPHKSPQERAILSEGQRNDALTRYAGALRRKGAEMPELERKLLEANLRRCRPPLGDAEVMKIAASIARYPAGGPDPLESAWEETRGEAFSSNEARFLALCRHLQHSRPNLDIALPLKKIGGLMGLHWTRISDYRKAAVKRGVLIPTEQYVAHARAGRYCFMEAASEKRTSPLTMKTLTRDSTLTRSLTSGLVRNSPSENPPSEDAPGDAGYVEVLL